MNYPAGIHASLPRYDSLTVTRSGLVSSLTCGIEPESFGTKLDVLTAAPPVKADWERGRKSEDGLGIYRTKILKYLLSLTPLMPEPSIILPWCLIDVQKDSTTQ